MDQRLQDLYGDYRFGRIDRRTFLRKLAVLVGGVAAAGRIFDVLEDTRAHGLETTFAPGMVLIARARFFIACGRHLSDEAWPVLDLPTPV